MSVDTEAWLDQHRSKAHFIPFSPRLQKLRVKTLEIGEMTHWLRVHIDLSEDLSLILYANAEQLTTAYNKSCVGIQWLWL